MTPHDARRADTRGLWLMVASAACFAAMAPFSRRFLQAIEPQSIVLARAVVMTALFAAWGALRGLPLGGRDRRGLLLRGVVGWLAISCYVWSTQHLPSGQAVLLQYSHPVFVALLAPWLLRERPGPLHWPLVLLGLAGLAIALEVGASFERAAAIGLIGALLSGIAYLTVRRISATERPLTIVFWFSWVMLPCSLASFALPESLIDGVAARLGALPASALTGAQRHVLPRDGGEWLGYTGVVVAGLIGQLTLTEGLQRAGAARAVAVTMVGPLFGLAFDACFFRIAPTPLALGGTLLVVATVALLAFLKPAAPAATAASGADSPLPPRGAFDA